MVEFAAVGLKLNTDKCKTHFSVRAPRVEKKLTVDGVEFPLGTSKEGFSLLGTTFSLTSGTQEEVQHRINIGWGKFHSIWYLLRHRASPLREQTYVFSMLLPQLLSRSSRPGRMGGPHLHACTKRRCYHAFSGAQAP